MKELTNRFNEIHTSSLMDLHIKNEEKYNQTRKGRTDQEYEPLTEYAHRKVIRSNLD
jgi:hypothetical protein